jgi:3-keto-5-aminohexanoate cleavage enzyme
MSDARKVIVTIAPTGGMANKTMNPDLPTQPEEIAESVYKSWQAGASVVALHARRPDDEATCDPEIYSRINELVRERCDIILNNSTGGGINGDMVKEYAPGRFEISFEERIKGTEAGAEMCTFDPQTLSVHMGDHNLLNETSLQQCIRLAEAMRDRNIKPEWEVYSNADLGVVQRLIGMGFDEAPHYINIVLGTDKNFSGTLPYSPVILQRFVDDLPPNSVFGVSAIGPSQLAASVHSVLLGGHARVGLEDNLYYRHGELATNEQLVQRMVRILHELNLEPATPTEAREILGLRALVASTT